MITRKNIDVDGVIYDVGQLGASRAWEAAAHICELEGAIMGALHSDAEGRINVVAGLGCSMAALARGLGSPEFRRRVMEPILEQVLCEGKPVMRDFEDRFTGRIGHLTRLLAAAVNHSIGPDFRSAFAGFSPTTQGMQEASEGGGETAGSTGSSGRP